VVGCSAEGKPDGEALGTTSQAQGTFNPQVGGVNSSKDLQFSGEFKLTASKILIVGGYNAAGNGQTSAGIITNSSNGVGTWTALSSALPTGLREVEIAQLTASKFLVAGGRATRDGAAVTNTYVLTLNVANGNAAWSAVNNMGQARVIGKNNLLKCGSTGSRWIAIGGITNGGMADAAVTNATDSIEVYDYKAGVGPTWTTLVKTGTSTVVKLPTNGKGYHQVMSPNVSKFIVAGGVTNAIDSAVNTVQILTVDNTCKALAASVDVNNRVNTSATSMPAARARGASIKASGLLTITSPSSTFSYDFIIATGNNATRFSTTPPTDIFFYDSVTNTWNGTFADITNGRVFGRLVQDEGTATSVRMGTGVVPGAPGGTDTLLYDTASAASTNVISNAGAVSAGTSITNGRVGSAVQLFGLANQADYAALGTGYTAGNPPTAAAKNDVFDF